MQDDSFNTNAVSSVSPTVNVSAVPDQTFAPETLAEPSPIIAGDSLMVKNAEDMLKKVGATDGEESLVGNEVDVYQPVKNKRQVVVLGRRLSRELVVGILLILSLFGVVFASVSSLKNSSRGNDGSGGSSNLSITVGGLTKSDNSPQQQIFNNSILNLNRTTLISGGHSLTTTGDVLVQSTINSADAFKIQNAGGNNLLVADTVKGTVTINNLVVGSGGLKVGGDITSSTNAYSLTSKGLSLNGVLVCTSAGCISQGQSSSLNTANLASLIANQTFSGINHFTSAGNTFSGDGSGLSALNASNITGGTLNDSRLSANVVLKNGNNTLTGNNTFTQLIQASGGVNAASYSVNGTAGADLTCPASQLLSQPVIQSGIITGGLCVPGAGASVATLQESYDVSVPATVILSSASGPVSLQDGASPLGTNLFQVTDNSGATKYFAVSAAGVSMTGNVNTTGVYQVAGVQISSANLSNDGNLAKLNANQTFTGNNTFSSASNSFTGSGAGLTALNASNISSGTLNDGRLSSNVALLNGTGPQTFSGNNKFTGTLLSQNAVNSAAAFSIQNAAGSSNLFIADTSNNRIGIGKVATNGILDVNGDIYQNGSKVCDMSGNCTGVTGIGGSGSNGTIALFTGTGTTIGNSLLTQSGGTITDSGNLNLTLGNTFQINNTQISSADLSNDGNLAKLNGNQTFSGNNTFSSASNSFTGSGSGLTNLNASNISSGTLSDSRLSGNVAILNGTGPQTFTGNNKYTGTVLSQNSSNSTNAFSIQNAAGTSNLLIADTTNTRIAIGQASASYTLDVGGDINTTGSFRVAGNAGSSLTCSGGNVLQNPVVSGGIITGGSCVANGGGGTNTLASVYAAGASQTDETLLLDSTRNGVLIRDNSTPIGVTLFGVQNSTGSTKYLDVTASGVAVAGNINISGQYQIGGVQISSSALSNDSNLAKLNGNQTFTGTNTFSNAGNSFTGDGSGLTSLNASNVSSGTINDARLSANVALLNGTGPQTFTGNNKFTGTVLSQNSANSTAAFQIQNSAGTSNLLIADTTNSKVGIGLQPASSGATLQLLGNQSISNGTTNAALQITQTANTSASVTTGGAINLDNTSNTGAGVVVYSNQATPSGRLFVINSANASFNQDALRVQQNGTGNGESISVTNVAGGGVGAAGLSIADDAGGGSASVHGISVSLTGSGNANASAANFVSANAAASAVQISGSETGRGSLKISHTGTGTDANASGLSIDLQGAGTAAQGIFLDATGGGTTGNLINLKNNNTQVFVINSEGQIISKPRTDSTTAFQIQPSASSTPVFDVDTSNSRVGIGLNNPQQALDVSGSARVSSFFRTNNGLVNDSSANNSRIQTVTNGTIIDRNVADSNTALTVQQINASSTGDILQLKNNSATVATVSQTGAALFKNSANSTSAFQIQNAAGTGNLFIADTTNGRVGIGKAPTQGTLDVNGDIYQSGNKVCDTSGNCAGVGGTGNILNNGNSFGTDVTLGTNDSHNFNVETNGINQVTVAVGGAATFKNSTNSTTAFQIQNAAGTSNLLIADTTNSKVGIGKAPTLGVLDVNGAIYQSGNQVCDTSGNCVGTGGGALGGSGTVGTIPVFTGSGFTVGDSLLSQSGSTVTDNGNLNLTTGHTFQINSTQISSADLSNDANLAKLNANQTFSGNNTFSSASNSFTGDGSGLTSLNATNVSSGTLADGRLSSNVPLKNAANTFTNTNAFQATSSTAFQLQSASAAETLFTANAAARTSGAAGNVVTIGNATGTDTNTTVLVLDSAASAPTTNLGSLSGGLFYNSGNNHIDIVENGVVKELCNKTDLGCGSAATPTLAQVYGYGASQTDETILLDSTRNGVLIRDNSTPLGGTLFGVQSSTGGTKYLDVGAVTVSINDALTVSNLITANGGINVAGGQNLNFAGATGNFDQSSSSGTFKTGTGAVSLNGDSTVAAGKNLSFASGAGSFDAHLGTGTFDTTTGTNTLNGNVTVAGTKTFTVNGGNTSLGANLDVTSSVAFKHGTDISTTGTLDDQSIGNVSLIRLTGSSTQTLDGIVNSGGNRDGEVLTIINAGSANAVIADEAAGSTAANRIRTGTGGNISLAVNSSITLVYDSQAARWRVNGAVAGSSGSGVTTVGAFASCTSYANGAQISSNTLTFSCADITNPGLVSTGAQTWAGAKSFNGLITGSAGLTVTGGAVSLTGNAASSLTTTSGALSLQGDGGVNLTTTNKSGAATNDILIASGNVTSGAFASGNVSIDVGASTGTKGTLSLGNTNASAISIGSSGSTATTISIGNATSGTTFAVESGTGTTALFNGATSHTVQLATGAAAQIVTIGSTNSTSALTLQSGSGGIGLNGATTVAGTNTFTVNGGNTSLGANLDVTSSVAFKHGTDISTAGVLDDQSIGNVSLIRLTGSSAQTLDGIVNSGGNRDGEILTVINAGSGNATIADEAAGSTAANRIRTGAGANVSLAVNSSITLVYDFQSSRWRVVGDVAGGVGSGVTTVGAFASCTSYANGAQISSNTITFSCADITNPGLVSTGVQTWAGAKSFNNLITGNAGLTVTGGAVSLTGNAASSLTTSSGDLTIDATSGSTPNINIGTGGQAKTIQLGNTTSAVAQTINIGNNSTASSSANINIGSSVAGTTAITGPTTVTNRTSGSSDTFNVNNSTSTGTIAKFQDNGTSVLKIDDNGATTLSNTVNSKNAFVIQNSSANNNLFLADTTNNNVINNASFEVGMGGWTNKTGCTLTRITTVALFGNSAADCTNTATANAGLTYTKQLTASTTYTLLFYAKSSTASANVLNYGYQQNGGGEDVGGLSATNQTITSTGWNKYALTFTTGGTTAAGDYLYIKQSDATARDIYVDGVTVEAASGIANYTEGKLQLNGYINSPIVIKNQGDNTTAFQVQTAGGNQLLGIDTLNDSLGIGSTASSILGSTTNIANTTDGTGIQAVNIGSNANANNSVTIKAGTTGGINIGTTGALTSSSTINIANTSNGSGTQIIGIGSSANTANSVTIKAGSTGGITLSTLTSATANSAYLCRDTSTGLLTACNTTGTSGIAFMQGGNSFGNPAVLGTTDSNSLSFETNSATQATIAVGGATTFKNSANSTAAFLVQNAAGTGLFNIDDSSTPNLLTNPSIQSAIAGNWATKVSATVTQDSTQQYIGSKSLKVVTAATADDGVKQSITLTPSTQYSLSFDGKLDSGSAAFATLAAGYSSTGLTAGDVNCTLNNTTVSTVGWTHYYCTFTTPGSNSGTPYIYIKQTNAVVHTFYIDAVQLQTGASATAYQDGQIAINTTIISPTTFKNQGDSDTAFQIQNAAGSNLVQVDSTNSNITLNGNNSGELQAWATNTNTLPAARNGIGSVYANGYIYVIGGGATGSNTVYYAKVNANGSTGAFSTNTNNLPFNRKFAPAVTANGYVYVVAGTSDGTAANAQSTVFYAKLNADGSTGTWTTNSIALPNSLYGATSVIANGYLYVIGGNNTSSTAQSTVYYAKLNADGSTGSWTTSANPLPFGRYGATATVANGYIYVLGGIALNNVHFASLNSDGSTSTWTSALSSLPANSGFSSVAVANGYLYDIGRDASSAVYYTTMNSNGTINGWTTEANALPDTIGESQAVVANGYIYIAGGYNGTTQLSSVYYASTPRIKLGGSLDLVGLGAQTLANPGDFSQGSTGGSLTAGNTNIVGSLQVAGQANFSQGVSVLGNFTDSGSAIFQNAADSATAFQVQNAAGNRLLGVRTDNNQILLGSASQTVQLQTFGTPGGDGIDLATPSGSATDANYVAVGGQRARFGYDGAGNAVVKSNGGFAVYTNTQASNVFNIASNGAAVFQNQANSTTAFQVQNATTGSEAQLFLLDTTNTNLIANSSAETNAAGWSNTAGTGTAPASDSTQKLFGNKSLAVNTSATLNAGVKYDTATLLSPSTTYSLSFWAKIASGSFVVQAGRSDTDAFGGETSCGLNTGVSTNWARYTCSFTTGGSVTTGGYIFIRQSDAISRSWYIDGVQLEQSAAPTNYNEGKIQLNGIIDSPTVFQNQADSTTAFQIQNAAGTSNLLVADTTGAGAIGIGMLPTNNELLQVGAGGIGVYNGASKVGSLNGNTGLQVITTGTSAWSNLGTDSGSTNILNLYNSSNAVVGSVSGTGAVLFKNSTNSTTAFQVQNAAGNQLFNIDTSSNSGVSLADGYVINNGTHSIGNALENPGFEGGGTAPGTASGWGVYTGTGLVTDAANAHSGNRELQTTIAAGDTCTAELYAVQPGQTIYYEGYVKRSAGGGGSGGFMALFYDKDVTNVAISSGDIWTDPGTSYTLRTNTATVPAGKYFMLVCTTTRGSATGTWYFDDMYLKLSTETAPSIFKNSVDSTTAFQIQNAAGTALLTADTTNSQIIVKGINSAATLGSELLSGSTCSGTNWSGSGTGPYTHTAGSIVALNCTPPASVTSGAVYQIVFTVGTTTAGTVTANIGGTNGPSISTATTNETELITTTGTGTLQFTPTSPFNGTVTIVSVKLLTNSNNVLSLANSDGTIGLETRSGGSGLINTLIGAAAGRSVTTGNNLVALGANALQNDTTGYGNTGVGSSALKSNTTGYNNTATGNNALSSNAIGFENAAFGTGALQNATASDNAAFGYGALSTLSIGTQNASLGAFSLGNTSTGSANTGFGALSGGNNVTGNFNTFVGNSAGYLDPYVSSFVSLSNLQAATAIGFGSQVQQNNSLILGGQGANATNIGIGTTAPDNLFSISPDVYDTGTASTSASATVVGSGTTWTASMVGDDFIFANGNKYTITGFTDTTHLTLSASSTNGSQAYRIHNQAFYVTNTGSAALRSSTNSTTAFQIQNASGTSLFTADTTNGNIQIGSSTTDATANLLVLDSYNNGTDPSGTNGAMYYNSSLGTLRCYQAGAWANCIGTGSSPKLQDAYNNSTGGTTPEIKLDSTRGGLDIQDADSSINNTLFAVRASNGSGLGAGLLTVDSTGKTVFKNSSNSSSAFQIQNAAGSSQLALDTTYGVTTLGGTAVLGASSATASTASDATTTLDSTASFLSDPPVTAKGSDGLPIIAYYSFSSTLKVAKCNNASCSSNTLTTVDSSSADVGDYTSMAIGSDGFPFISYYDRTNGDLRVTHCGNVGCTAGNTATSIDTTGNVGIFTSTAIGTDGLPVISYVNNATGDLKVAKCGNITCSSGNTISTVETAIDNLNTSITVAPDGLPIITYETTSSLDMRVAKCGNAACSSGNTLTSIDTTGTVGAYSSVTIDSDGLPIISYYDSTNTHLKTAKCTIATCASGNTITTVDSTASTGVATSITTGTDGLPIIAYATSGGTNTLKVAKCVDLACSSSATITTVGSAGASGAGNSIIIGTDGLPFIANATSGGNVLSTRCGNISCSGGSSTTYTGGVGLGSAASALQYAYINSIRANSAANPFTIQYNNVNRVTIDTSGNITFNGNVIVGSSTAHTTNPILLVTDNYNNATEPTEIDGAIYYNASTKNFRCGQSGGWVGCIGGLLGSNTGSSSTIASCTNACGSLANASIPANYCQAGRVIKVHAQGRYGSTGAPTLQFSFYYGTDSSVRTNDTLVHSTTAATISGTSNAYWSLETTIECWNTTTMNTSSVLTISGAGTTLLTVYGDTTSTATVSSGSAKNLYLFPTWSANNASNGVLMDQYVVTGT